MRPPRPGPSLPWARALLDPRPGPSLPWARALLIPGGDEGPAGRVAGSISAKGILRMCCSHCGHVLFEKDQVQECLYSPAGAGLTPLMLFLITRSYCIRQKVLP